MAIPDFSNQTLDFQLHRPFIMALSALIVPLGLFFAVLSFANGDTGGGIGGLLYTIGAFGIIVIGAHQATRRIANPPSISAEALPLIVTITPKAHIRHMPIGQYVYIIQDEDVTHLCKIGKTQDPSRRITDHGVLLPFAIRIVCVLPVRNMAKSEAALHRIFASKRVKGEWFALTESDVAKIVEVVR